MDEEIIISSKLTEIFLDEKEVAEIRNAFENELNILKSTYDLKSKSQSVKDGYSQGIIAIWYKYAGIVKEKIMLIIDKTAGTNSPEIEEIKI